MSFVRAGEDDSDVYVYQDVRGFVTYCGCAFNTRDLGAMLDHLAGHRRGGDTVPNWLDGELRAGWPYRDGEPDGVYLRGGDRILEGMAP